MGNYESAEVLVAADMLGPANDDGGVRSQRRGANGHWRSAGTLSRTTDPR